jgi:hypothetical protein
MSARVELAFEAHPARSSRWFRFATIAGLWCVAVGIVVIERSWFQWLAEQNSAAQVTSFVIASAYWRYVGIFIPLGLLTASFALQFGWYRGFWRGLAAYGLAAMTFAWLFGLVAAGAGGPAPINGVWLDDGRHYILAEDPIPTDLVYTLYEPVGVLGLHWRLASNLDYSEDGRFTGDTQLILSTNQRWLLVTRGGVWTDCFSVAQRQLQPCHHIETGFDWSSPTYEADMHERSRRIAALTGLRVP